MSEDEYEARVKEALVRQHMEPDDLLMCEHDASPSLVVTRFLTTQAQEHEDQ